MNQILIELASRAFLVRIIVSIFQSMGDNFEYILRGVCIIMSCLIKDSNIKKYSGLEDYLQASHKLTHTPLLKPRQARG
jgi:hypothetical protein